MADPTTPGYVSLLLTGLAAHGFELLSAVAVAAVTSIGTFLATRTKLRVDLSKAAADSYERRHDKMMVADAQDRQTFRRQLMDRVELLEKKLLACTDGHARASETINEQQRHIYHLQRDLDRLVGRVNEMGASMSQFADMTDIPGLAPKGAKQ